MCKRRQDKTRQDKTRQDRARDSQRQKESERGVGGEGERDKRGYEEAAIACMLSHFIINSLPCPLTITTMHIHTLQLVNLWLNGCNLLV